MHTSTTIANFFIEKGVQENKPVDQMKVQKLVYFAHGWHLAIAGKPLLNESIEAWPFGPVIPSLYHVLKHSGKQPIRTIIKTDYTTSEDKELISYLERIWKLYSPFTGIQLSNMTHEETAPWSAIAKEFKNQIPPNTSLRDEIIRDYFMIKKNQLNSHEFAE
jgi:uncharacterized phage-associated protein